MKITIHSGVLNELMSLPFRESIKTYADSLSSTDKTVKEIQLYSDFYLPNATYPFVSDGKVYYPVTLICKAGEYKTDWICWDKDIEYLSPISFPYGSANVIEIVRCAKVPQAFCDMVADKKFIFVQNPDHAAPEMGSMMWQHKGEINCAFLDELSRQVSDRLIELSGCRLSPKWSVTIPPEYGTVTAGDTHYRVVQLKTSSAQCLSIVVSWKENYDVFDYVAEQDIKFRLTEFEFFDRGHSFDEIVEFIQNHGFKRLNVLNKYPQMMLEIRFDGGLTQNIEDAVLSCAEEYVSKWNSEPGNDKIVEFYLYDSDKSNAVLIFFDFGECVALAAERVSQHFKQVFAEKKTRVSWVQF